MNSLTINIFIIELLYIRSLVDAAINISPCVCYVNLLIVVSKDIIDVQNRIS